MKKPKITDIAFWLFFIIMILLLIVRFFTVHYGVSWFLDRLSEAYDFVYNLISFGALLMVIFAFGISIQTSQRLKDDVEYNVRQECKKILKDLDDLDGLENDS